MCVLCVLCGALHCALYCVHGFACFLYGVRVVRAVTFVCVMRCVYYVCLRLFCDLVGVLGVPSFDCM